MTRSTAVDAEAAAELAAPLDLLLTDSVLGIGRRMLPSRAWLHFGESLLKRPQLIAGRCRSLADELADIARGRSARMPARSDKRFADTAWSENPLLRRTMQAYLAGADTAGKLLGDADLDWRDRERMQFVIDNIVEAFAPTNNPLLNPLGYKALIDTGGASAVRGMSNRRDRTSGSRIRLGRRIPCCAGRCRPTLPEPTPPECDS
jgi:polyhydroxyalkanoate synthase